MQAALRDLVPTRKTNPRPFLICQRVLHRCHEIIFGDPPEPSRSPYRSLPHSPPTSTAALHPSSSMQGLWSGLDDESVRRPPVRVKEHVLPALVGIGVVLAAPGMKGLADLAGEWAVLQGRKARDDEAEGRARVEVDQSGGADVPATGTANERERKASEETDASDDGKTPSPESSAITHHPQHQTSTPHHCCPLPRHPSDPRGTIPSPSNRLHPLPVTSVDPTPLPDDLINPFNLFPSSRRALLRPGV